VNKIIKTSSIIILLLSIFELIIRLYKLPVYLIPTPSKVIFTTWEYRNELLNAIMWTSIEALIGLFIAISFAIICGLLFIRFKPVEESVKPFLIALQGTPVLALAPILTAWFGTGLGSKVICTFIVCFFPLVVGITSGLRSPTIEEIELFKTFGISEWKILWNLRIPRCVPWFFSALKVAVPLSVIGAIVSEFVGSSNGIGFIILTASYYLKIAKMFSGILCCTGLSICLFGIVRIFEKKVYFWEGN